MMRWLAALVLIWPVASAADCTLLAAPDARALAQFGAGTPDCQTARSTRGPVALCFWAHGYRSDAATAQYDAMVQAVATCAGAQARAQAGVNHPDTYGQSLFTLAGRSVSVALKDKAAQGQSLVILRVE